MRRLLVVALLLLTTGCSQAAALAPVGGGHLTEVRFAALDLLVQRGVAILVAPVCTDTADDISCRGTTVDGAVVLVRSPAADRTQVTVTVGDEMLYQGPIQDVLDSAARPTP